MHHPQTARAHEITFIETGRGQICNELLRSLPEWFGIESAIQQYVRDAEEMPMFCAKGNGQVTGFLSLRIHNPYTAEIHVMGVHPTHHRSGIGRALVQFAESYAAQNKVEFLTVKTLSSSRNDEHYARTRQFYLAMGFRPLEEFKTLWGEANPCLMLAKSIGRSF